jgi:AcrR family transcriptional regulator
MDVREKILRATTDLIRRDGPAGAKARTICDMVGVKAPTLYYYFGDMEKLREEVVTRAFTQILEGSTAGLLLEGGVGGLKRSWDAYLTFAEREPAMFSVLTSRIMDGPVPQIVFHSLTQFEAMLSGPEFDGKLRYPAARSAHILWAAAQGAGCLQLANQSGVPLSEDLGSDMFDAIMASLMLGEREST